MPVQGVNNLLNAVNSLGEKNKASQSEVVSFSSLVSNSLENVLEKQKTAETLSVAAMKDSGSVDMHQLITAVSEAELQLQTMISIRDKTVEAYNKIMDMPL